MYRALVAHFRTATAWQGSGPFSILSGIEPPVFIGHSNSAGQLVFGASGSGSAADPGAALDWLHSLPGRPEGDPPVLGPVISESGKLPELP